jgi:predicted DNA-binding transcriptional regulator YafY
MCSRFNISRRQFYKDREDLERLGFSFHYSRSQWGFVLDKELTFQVGGMSLSGLFALILAVRELTRLSDFGLAMGALNGLRNLVEQLPEDMKPMFSDALDQVVVADGFGCSPEVLHELSTAIQDGRRVVLVTSDGGSGKTMVDPKRLFLREGNLYLEAEGIDEEGAGLIALSRLRKVIPMPLFRQG